MKAPFGGNILKVGTVVADKVVTQEIMFLKVKWCISKMFYSTYKNIHVFVYFGNNLMVFTRALFLKVSGWYPW